MIYENETIKLVPFTRKHVTDEYKSWFTCPDVTRYNSHGVFDMTDSKIESFLASIDNGDCIVWAILYKKTGKVNRIEIDLSTHIGNISLQSIDYTNSSAELAVIIGNKDYWGKGIATQAGRFLLEHAFNKLNLNRVYLGTCDLNAGMKKVAESLGMLQEGISRQSMYLHGNYEDVVSYGIIKEDWLKHGSKEK